MESDPTPCRHSASSVDSLVDRFVLSMRASDRTIAPCGGFPGWNMRHSIEPPLAIIIENGFRG
jgi:hypothetical protein